MKVGQRVRAEVVEVRDNGIFLTQEDRRGIVPVVELTWNATEDPSPHRFAKVGDELEVLVTSLAGHSFGASIKRLDPSANPWLHPRIHVGARHSGRVHSVRPFGTFVALDVGLMALLRSTAELRVGERCELELTLVEPDNKIEGELVVNGRG